MKKLILLLFLSTNSVFAETYPACDVSSKSQHELYPGQVVSVEVKIKGSPCYEAKLEIEVSNTDKSLYSYNARFKPHVAIPWELLTEQDARNFANRVSSQTSIIQCKDLEPLNNELFYVSPLVPAEEYDAYKKSNCKAFYHQTHYEAGITIVIPKGVNKAVPVNNYGV